jgi:regulator of cell morphogenesis and NO signaling
MTIPIDANTTVRELAGRYPQCRHVFAQHQIDYYCGGSQTLDQAAHNSGTDLSALLAALREKLHAAPSQPAPGRRDWYAAPLPELVEYIVQVHHNYMKAAIPRIEGLLRKVVHAHGANHGKMLSALETQFQVLADDVGSHLIKEEQILFPYIAATAAGDGGERPVACFGSLRNPIGQMEHEHDVLGRVLETMRQITGGYSLPADACPTFAALYDELMRMEADLHEHIHLENNILFPRAIAEESAHGPAAGRGS